MKVLAIYVNEFSYQPAEKNLEEAETIETGATHLDSILTFIHVEETDEQHDVKSREKKLVKLLNY